MVTVISIMTAGIVIGLFVRNMNGFLKIMDRLIILAIFLLLFFLGVAVGVNEMIIQNLGSYGLIALLLTLGGVAGSVVLALLVYRGFFKRER